MRTVLGSTLKVGEQVKDIAIDNPIKPVVLECIHVDDRMVYFKHVAGPVIYANNDFHPETKQACISFRNTSVWYQY